MAIIIDGTNGIILGTLSINESSGISQGSLAINNTTGISVGSVTVNNANGASLVTADAAPFLVGQVCFFAMNSTPAGFLKCNGAAVSRTTYSALFSAIGTTYGAGNGSTTFTLPDLRGEFLRCLDDGRGIDSGRAMGTFQNSTRVMGQIFGSGFGFGGRVGSDNDLIDNGDTGSGQVNVGAWGDLWGGVGPPAVQWIRNTVRTRPRNIALLACIKF
jgi:phage-related tail fiber protein